MIEGFLLGIIVTSTFVAAMFFLRFWRRTGDGLFFAFGLAFLIETFNRCAVLLNDTHDGFSWIYVVRLASYGVILAGIVQKNRRPRNE
jgi:hypothetical protein